MKLDMRAIQLAQDHYLAIQKRGYYTQVIELPHQEHPFFFELLTLNLFMREPVYIREAYKESTNWFKSHTMPMTLPEQNAEHIEAEYYVEGEQLLAPQRVTALKEWVLHAENLLTSKFLEGCPEIFYALEGFLNGDAAYRGAYGTRIRDYVTGLDALLGSASSIDREPAQTKLARRIPILLAPFLDGSSVSYDAIIYCYKIRNDLLHSNPRRSNQLLLEEPEPAEWDWETLAQVEQLRDLLRQLILCCMAFHLSGQWRSRDIFGAWLDKTNQQAISNKVLRVTKPLWGAIQSGKRWSVTRS
jgi:hypothetical protein